MQICTDSSRAKSTYILTFMSQVQKNLHESKFKSSIDYQLLTINCSLFTCHYSFIVHRRFAATITTYSNRILVLLYCTTNRLICKYHYLHYSYFHTTTQTNTYQNLITSSIASTASGNTASSTVPSIIFLQRQEQQVLFLCYFYYCLFSSFASISTGTILLSTNFANTITHVLQISLTH